MIRFVVQCLMQGNGCVYSGVSQPNKGKLRLFVIIQTKLFHLKKICSLPKCTYKAAAYKMEKAEVASRILQTNGHYILRFPQKQHIKSMEQAANKHNPTRNSLKSQK